MCSLCWGICVLLFVNSELHAGALCTVNYYRVLRAGALCTVHFYYYYYRVQRATMLGRLHL